MFNNLKLQLYNKLLQNDPDNIKFAKYFNIIESHINQNELISDNFKFAISYSPEQLDWLQSESEFANPHKINHIQALDFIIDELGIKDIRLGLRWSQIDKNGVFDLTYYKGIINHLLKKEVRIILNLGPVKTFRWPEVFVPEYILNKLDLKSKKELIIDSNHQVSIQSIKYLEKLFEEFRINFGENFFTKIYAIQPENELFNPFGEYLWTLGNSHILEVVKISKKYFPEAKILFSGSGDINLDDILYPDIFKINDLISYLSKNIKTKYIFGLNYYYKAPGFIKNSSGIELDNFSRLKIINGDDILSDFREFALEMDSEIEISELQFEPWGEVKSPGFNLNELIFAINRILLEKIYNDKIILRLWGVELLAYNYLTDSTKLEQTELIQFIRKYK